jgi:hypothetical protein
MAFARWWALKILFPQRQHRVCEIERLAHSTVPDHVAFSCLYLLAEGRRVQKSEALNYVMLISSGFYQHRFP